MTFSDFAIVTRSRSVPAAIASLDQVIGEAARHHQAASPPAMWETDPSGQALMSVNFGAKPIEFKKGKAGIENSPKSFSKL
jgi:hypothetical protein